MRVMPEWNFLDQKLFSDNLNKLKEQVSKDENK